MASKLVTALFHGEGKGRDGPGAIGAKAPKAGRKSALRWEIRGKTEDFGGN